MQETLFGDEEDESEKTVAEAIFENKQIEKEEPVLPQTARIDFKKNIEERKITMEEEAIEKQEAEDLDSLIARVVAKTKQEKEAQREKEDEERKRQKEVQKVEKEKQLIEQSFVNNIPSTPANNITFEDNNDDTEEFVKIVRNTDEEMKREAAELNEIRFVQSKPEVKEVVEEVKPVETVNEDINRFEPDSIKELRKKFRYLLSLPTLRTSADKDR